jgi:hypothetical protein
LGIFQKNPPRRTLKWVMECEDGNHYWKSGLGSLARSTGESRLLGCTSSGCPGLTHTGSWVRVLIGPARRPTGIPASDTPEIVRSLLGLGCTAQWVYGLRVNSLTASRPLSLSQHLYLSHVSVSLFFQVSLSELHSRSHLSLSQTHNLLFTLGFSREGE